MALHIGIGNFGGAFASNIYRTRDGPRYVLGREFDSSQRYLPGILSPCVVAPASVTSLAYTLAELSIR
jgi:hypothetical protein